MMSLSQTVTEQKDNLKRILFDLNVSLWSLFQPGFDWFQTSNTVYNTLQVWILFNQIGFNHVVEIVQNTSEVNVSPG